MTSIRLHLLHSTYPAQIHQLQDANRNLLPVKEWPYYGWTVSQCKSNITSFGYVSYHELHLFMGRPTLDQVKDGEVVELADDRRLVGAANIRGEPEILDVSLTVGWRPFLKFQEFRNKLPHFSELAAKAIYKEWTSGKMTRLIDWNSVIEEKEAVIEQPELVANLKFWDHTRKAECHQLETSGEVFVPNRIIGSMVEVVGRYTIQYRGTTDEVITKFKKEYAAYESEFIHCKKLLHELPIALANNQKQIRLEFSRLKRETAVESNALEGLDEEKSTDVTMKEDDSNDKKVTDGMKGLGELAYEQGSIGEEIEKQEIRLKSLIRPTVNETEFIPRQYQTRLTLPYHDGFIHWSEPPIPITFTDETNLSDAEVAQICRPNLRQIFAFLQTNTPSATISSTPIPVPSKRRPRGKKAAAAAATPANQSRKKGRRN